MHPDTVRAAVHAHVRTAGGLPPEHPLHPGDRLLEDLGVDSIALVTVITETEEQLGVPIPDEDLAYGRMALLGELTEQIVTAVTRNG